MTIVIQTSQLFVDSLEVSRSVLAQKGQNNVLAGIFLPHVRHEIIGIAASLALSLFLDACQELANFYNNPFSFFQRGSGYVLHVLDHRRISDGSGQ